MLKPVLYIVEKYFFVRFPREVRDILLKGQVTRLICDVKDLGVIL